jgi:hypothetical protein
MNLLDSHIVIYAGHSPFQGLEQLLQPLPTGAWLPVGHPQHH